jgi:CspA family cold shock protein
LVRERGFGFIKSDDGQDLFFHRSELQGVAFDSLKEGQSVEFGKGEGPKGPKAVNIKLIKKQIKDVLEKEESGSPG